MPHRTATVFVFFAVTALHVALCLDLAASAEPLCRIVDDVDDVTAADQEVCYMFEGRNGRKTQPG